MKEDCVGYFEELLASIRISLAKGTAVNTPDRVNEFYDPAISQVYVTLFQEECQFIRWGARKNNLTETIERIIQKIRSHPRFDEFSILESKKCRIMIELVTGESPCTIRNLTAMNVSKNRFEPGVTGIKYIYKGVTRFFMPTDAITQSIMTVNQLLNYLSKKTGIAKQTNKISERVYLMRREPIEYTFIESMAYISYFNKALPLYRGYPALKELSQNTIYKSALNSIDWLVENMNKEGGFLYFYDGIKDTKVDLDHPKMTAPLYNNILRHSGGTITLLRGYELSGDKIYLNAAKKSIDFFLSTCRSHQYKKKYACYPFFNKKSKLGGAGIGLVALMHYYMHTADEAYRKQIDGLVRHILSRVDKEGEMLGYYIHPKFNAGKAIINPSDEVKKELFSFYYPGEALLGLALYYRHIKNIDPSIRNDVYQKSLKALDFLVDVRPVKYDYLFDALPADAWLMQAIEEWVKVDGFRKQSYIDFVFNDTQAMFDHMYTEENAIAPDYVGGFFYEYGDHVYHDASRNEGVVAAYFLAKYLGEEGRKNYIMGNMLKSAQGLMRTIHTAESTYAHTYPEKSINSFRFKLTRQWVRVDSVQHAACFFARLYQSGVNPATKSGLPLSPILGGYQVQSTLASSGYGDVYKVNKIGDKNKLYALKKLKQTRYINFIEKEAKISTLLNEYHGSNNIGVRDIFWYGGSVHFVFNYIAGGDLKSYIEKNGPSDEVSAVKMLSDLLNTLKFTQEKNILHLDIKPANILLDDMNNYYLADWGLASMGGSVDTLHIKGNPLYLAPETYMGKRCFASEIYSLGATLYYMLMRRPIFNLRKRDSLAKKVYSHCYLELENTHDISEKMHHLISRMMDKNPETRATTSEVEAIIQDKHNNYPKKLHIAENNLINLRSELVVWKALAKSGVVYAMYKLAEWYKKEGELEQAVDWYEKAADQGLASAECELAGLYALNNEHPEKMLELLQRSSAKGFDKAQYLLGVFLEDNKAVNIGSTAENCFIASAKNAYKPAYLKLKSKNIVIRANINFELKAV